MRVIAVKILREFWQQARYSDAENSLKAWYTEVKHASWRNTQNIKNKYRHASFLGDNKVVFNIHGNKYRLVVHINYAYQIGYIKFVGTHKQYDEIDAENI